MAWIPIKSQLDTQLESWTSTLDDAALAKQLQTAGLCAGQVKNARESIEDPHLGERKFWVYLDHPEVGATLYNRAPIVFSKTPLQMTMWQEW